MRRLLLIAPFALLPLAGCGDGGGRSRLETGSVQPPVLQEAALPSLEGVEPALQERLRARYASLLAIRQAAGTSPAELARAYGEMGTLLVGANFFASAEPFLANAHTLDPAEMAWPYYLGHARRMQNDADGAIRAFENAVKLKPDYPAALVWIGLLHLDAGRVDEAAPYLQRAAALQPRSAALRLALGRLALARGDYARAVEELTSALAARPEAASVHYPLALAYRGLGDRERAEHHLRQWKKGDVFPEDPLMEEAGDTLQTAVAFSIQGTRALDEQRWADAAALFRKGLEIAPRDATLHQNLGTALFLGGDEEGARRAFEEAIRLSPGYARAHFSLGLVLDNRGREAEAVDRFRIALRHDPDLAAARFSLANALRRMGRVEESLEHYRALIAADPSASQARFGLAMGLVRLGRYQEARRELEQGAAAHPEQPGFAHALARVLAAAPDDRVRDGSRALALTADLLRKHGATPALIETSAMALAEVGRYGEAAARQRAAIEAALKEQRADLAERMQDTLRRYERREPCRVPWPDDDPVHNPR